MKARTSSLVIPDNRVLSRGYFFEHKQPVMGKYLTVEYVGSLNHRYTALLPEPFVLARFLALPVRSGESIDALECSGGIMTN